ncbi:ClbS/DfsB family four-helix bundle protein [Vibrio parahaemolyticus]|nr:ClbS/DfsB family four-helix bundle protein [Vibrio parahaemolyticus]
MSSVPKNKDELELAINSILPKLMVDYRSIPESKARKVGVEGNVKGKFISVSDTVAYLIGWGKLVLKWHQLGLLAESFHEEYRDWKYSDLLVELEFTIYEILLIISSLSDHELYGVAWYEQWTLGRMIQFNTSSPMKNMRTKVRRFNREFT